MESFTVTASFKESVIWQTKCFTSNRAHSIRHSIASSKKDGYRRNGTSTKRVEMQSSTNSPGAVVNNWKLKKLVGTDWFSLSINFDKQLKVIGNEVIQPPSRSVAPFGGTGKSH